MVKKTESLLAGLRPKPEAASSLPIAWEFVRGAYGAAAQPRLVPIIGARQPAPQQSATSFHSLCASTSPLPVWKRVLAATLAVLSLSANSESLRPSLVGVRLAEQGRPCAGWLFKSPEFVVRDEDSACGKSGQPTLVARVQWLDSKRVLLIESQLPGQRPQRPARVWLYTLLKSGGRAVAMQQAGQGRVLARESRDNFRR